MQFDVRGAPDNAPPARRPGTCLETFSEQLQPPRFGSAKYVQLAAGRATTYQSCYKMTGICF